MTALSHAGLTIALSDPPLSPGEQADLARLATVLTEGAKVFRAVAVALLEIRDRRLYRETHGTFEAYCHQKLGFSRMHGNRLAQAAKVIQECEAAGLPPPTTERQARRMRQESRQSPNGGELLARTEIQRPGLEKGKTIASLLAKLRELHASHPWRPRADELLDLYAASVLPWPAEWR